MCDTVHTTDWVMRIEIVVLYQCASMLIKINQMQYGNVVLAIVAQIHPLQIVPQNLIDCDTLYEKGCGGGL